MRGMIAVLPGVRLAAEGPVAEGDVWRSRTFRARAALPTEPPGLFGQRVN